MADSLAQLAERERSVRVMSCYDDHSAEAVSTQLGLSAGNVRVIHHHGVCKLWRCVETGWTAAGRPR